VKWTVAFNDGIRWSAEKQSESESKSRFKTRNLRLSHWRQQGHYRRNHPQKASLAPSCSRRARLERAKGDLPKAEHDRVEAEGEKGAGQLAAAQS
jgi:hypothetical protein